MASNRTFPSTRMRRLRQSKSVIKLIQESTLSKQDLIQPLFIADQKDLAIEIPSMPSVYRFNEDGLMREIEILVNNGINAVALFPCVDKELKDSNGSYAFNEQNFLHKALIKINKNFPEIVTIADVALDPYTEHGHDGLYQDGKVLNDETLEALVTQSLCLANAGATVLAPSDMMDGRIGAIRIALETNNFKDTLILSYAAKFCSKFYGPFRDAVGSKSQLGNQDKSSYQINPANVNEALQEVALDLNEGADMVMVKPGMPFLDVVAKVKETFKVPTFVYQVSGEYSMLMAAIHNGWLPNEVMLESLQSFKRAGADAILSYAAKSIAQEYLDE
ncbi:MAG: porphobilinogen synthase [Gammaproteobacteria bacterium]